MNEHDASATAENPFCSRRVRPGALPFLFAGDTSLGQLVDRLRQNGWWGQIVGPHGSGKSALLASLVPAIERVGRHAIVFELHDACRRLPFDLKHAADVDPATILIIDGYEQLSRWRRFQLKRFCRRRGLGLLVTVHTSAGLPELFHAAADLHLTERIVAELTRGYPAHVTAKDVAERYLQHGGDVREMLFGLYDVYEERRRRS